MESKRNGLLEIYRFLICFWPLYFHKRGLLQHHSHPLYVLVVRVVSHSRRGRFVSDIPSVQEGKALCRISRSLSAFGGVYSLPCYSEKVTSNKAAVLYAHSLLYSLGNTDFIRSADKI